MSLGEVDEGIDRRRTVKDVKRWRRKRGEVSREQKT